MNLYSGVDLSVKNIKRTSQEFIRMCEQPMAFGPAEILLRNKLGSINTIESIINDQRINRRLLYALIDPVGRLNRDTIINSEDYHLLTHFIMIVDNELREDIKTCLNSENPNNFSLVDSTISKSLKSELEDFALMGDLEPLRPGFDRIMNILTGYGNKHRFDKIIRKIALMTSMLDFEKSVVNRAYKEFNL